MVKIRQIRWIISGEGLNIIFLSAAKPPSQNLVKKKKKNNGTYPLYFLEWLFTCARQIVTVSMKRTKSMKDAAMFPAGMIKLILAKSFVSLLSLLHIVPPVWASYCQYEWHNRISTAMEKGRVEKRGLDVYHRLAILPCLIATVYLPGKCHLEGA